MKIIIEEIGDRIAISFTGKGKKSDRIKLLMMVMKKVTVVYDSFACVADIEPAEHSLSLILEDATADQLKVVPLPTNSESGLEANRLCYAIRWLERLAGRWFVYPCPIKAISIDEADA